MKWLLQILVLLFIAVLSIQAVVPGFIVNVEAPSDDSAADHEGVRLSYSGSEAGINTSKTYHPGDTISWTGRLAKTTPSGDLPLVGERVGIYMNVHDSFHFITNSTVTNGTDNSSPWGLDDLNLYNPSAGWYQATFTIPQVGTTNWNNWEMHDGSNTIIEYYEGNTSPVKSFPSFQVNSTAIAIGAPHTGKIVVHGAPPPYVRQNGTIQLQFRATTNENDSISLANVPVAFQLRNVSTGGLIDPVNSHITINGSAINNGTVTTKTSGIVTFLIKTLWPETPEMHCNFTVTADFSGYESLPPLYSGGTSGGNYLFDIDSKYRIGEVSVLGAGFDPSSVRQNQSTTLSLRSQFENGTVIPDVPLWYSIIDVSSGLRVNPVAYGITVSPLNKTAGCKTDGSGMITFTIDTNWPSTAEGQYRFEVYANYSARAGWPYFVNTSAVEINSPTALAAMKTGSAFQPIADNSSVLTVDNQYDVGHIEFVSAVPDGVRPSTAGNSTIVTFHVYADDTRYGGTYNVEGVPVRASLNRTLVWNGASNVPYSSLPSMWPYLSISPHSGPDNGSGYVLTNSSDL